MPKERLLVERKSFLPAFWPGGVKGAASERNRGQKKISAARGEWAGLVAGGGLAAVCPIGRVGLVRCLAPVSGPKAAPIEILLD